MQARSPHFLLFSDAFGEGRRCDHWRFVLQSVADQRVLAAEDVEPGTRGSRLELLAVVRGLESLDQPSRVTLVTTSRYVTRGIRRGLSQWRARRWRWERFGQLVPVRDHDLWQRVDRALHFHHVDCCAWHTEKPSQNETWAASAAAMPPARAAVLAPEKPALTPPASEPSESVPLAACEVVETPPEQALLTVQRPRRCRSISGFRPSPLALAFSRLRQTVLAPLAALWRPAFTRAA
ncbi:MAG: hypothetical protein L0Z07_02020 [Planctomycetes bacterium]|nr:hypothetical protein [Planctomycetota bacterium]